jgi:hypothetical protein
VLSEISCVIDQIPEATLTDLFSGLFDVFGHRVDAAGSKGNVLLEGACCFANIASKLVDVLRTRLLLLAGLIF